MRTKATKFPTSIIEKAPSAELKENQKDEDDLLPYDILDKILAHLVDNEPLPEGISEEKTNFVKDLIKRSEFKRKQAPPILRIIK